MENINWSAELMGRRTIILEKDVVLALEVILDSHESFEKLVDGILRNKLGIEKQEKDDDQCAQLQTRRPRAVP